MFQICFSEITIGYIFPHSSAKYQLTLHHLCKNVQFNFSTETQFYYDNYNCSRLS